MLSAGKRALEVFLSAGEASGDLHGANLVRSLRSIAPEARITCLGGPRLRESGAEVLVDNRDLAVVGLFEVVRHLPRILAAWRAIRAHLVTSPPQVLVLIDFPDFNFLLARLGQRLGIPVFYYISPQVWAWRGGRVRTLRRCVDRMAVILPFETEFYTRRGLRVDYVGHPLLDVLSEAPSIEQSRSRHRPPGADPVVGLLPGSRAGEVKTHLPLLLDAAALILERLPQVAFLLPVASSLDPDPIEREVRQRDLPVHLVFGDSYGAMRASDLLLAASGTVTLEATILGVPMIITYRVSPLSYAAGRRFIRVRCVGLPNLIAGRIVAPELLQYEARPENLARVALSLLESPGLLASMTRELEAIRGLLGEPGVSDRVARLVMETATAGQAGPRRMVDGVPGPLGGTRKALSIWPRAAPRDRWTIRSSPLGERGPVWFLSLASCLTIPLYPWVVLYYGLQSVLRGKYRSSRLMRLGLKTPDGGVPGDGPRIWIHALSVGETLSAVPLVKALRAEIPKAQFVFSTATETGQDAARKQLAPWVNRFFYMPHDFPWAVQRLVKRLRPDLFVLVETDVWPNLLMVLRQHGIPSLLVNGRLSPKSHRNLMALRPLARRVFGLFERVFVQSEDDRDRYVSVGVDPQRALAVGNLKFDAAVASPAPEGIHALREALGLSGSRRLWVAGSTHEGEEIEIARVHAALMTRHPGLLLIVAPRDIGRGSEVRAILEREGWKVGVRSQGNRTEGVDAYVLDTLGELRHVYSLGDVVFIGGSLVPFGGHNPLEAVAHGKPVCWGPHLFNFREIERDLIEAGCGVRVESREELERFLARGLQDLEYRRLVGRRSEAFLKRHEGAAVRIAEGIRTLIPRRAEAARHAVESQGCGRT